MRMGLLLAGVLAGLLSCGVPAGERPPAPTEVDGIPVVPWREVAFTDADYPLYLVIGDTRWPEPVVLHYPKGGQPQNLFGGGRVFSAGAVCPKEMMVRIFGAEAFAHAPLRGGGYGTTLALSGVWLPERPDPRGPRPPGMPANRGTPSAANKPPSAASAPSARLDQLIDHADQAFTGALAKLNLKPGPAWNQYLELQRGRVANLGTRDETPLVTRGLQPVNLVMGQLQPHLLPPLGTAIQPGDALNPLRPGYGEWEETKAREAALGDAFSRRLVAICREAEKGRSPGGGVFADIERDPSVFLRTQYVYWRGLSESGHAPKDATGKSSWYLAKDDPLRPVFDRYLRRSRQRLDAELAQAEAGGNAPLSVEKIREYDIRYHLRVWRAWQLLIAGRHRLASLPEAKRKAAQPEWQQYEGALLEGLARAENGEPGAFNENNMLFFNTWRFIQALAPAAK